MGLMYKNVALSVLRVVSLPDLLQPVERFDKKEQSAVDVGLFFFSHIPLAAAFKLLLHGEQRMCMSCRKSVSPKCSKGTKVDTKHG